MLRIMIVFHEPPKIHEPYKSNVIYEILKIFVYIIANTADATLFHIHFPLNFIFFSYICKPVEDNGP